MTSPQCAPSASGSWLIGILTPLARPIAREEVDAEPRLGVIGAVVGAALQDGARGALPDLNAVALGAAVGDLGEPFGEELVAMRLLRRIHRDQRVVRRLRDRGIEGCARGRVGYTGIAAVALWRWR